MFLYSFLSAALIFQYEPMMAVKGISQQLGLSLLSLIQIVIIFSIIIYGKFLDRGYLKEKVIRCTLSLRIVLSLLFYILPGGEIFLFTFLIYQIGATGLDIFFETSILIRSSYHKEEFGKFRMFGSLGYATSGFFITVLLMLTNDMRNIFLLIAFINGLLFYLNINHPVSVPEQKEPRITSKKKLPLTYNLLLICCTFIITVPNSFGYLLNSFYQEVYILELTEAALYSSIAVFIGSCISEMFGFYSTDWFVRRYSSSFVMFLGFIFCCIRWVLAYVSPHPIIFTLSYLFHGVSFAFLYFGCVEFIKNRVGRKLAGTIVFRFTFFANLSGVVLAQIYAVLLDHIESKTLLLFFIMVCFIGLAMYLYLIRRWKIDLFSF
ncbi:hypothetical protein IGI57_000116 [Enterococcus sp. DIV0213j]|jgi:hypothetical protein